MIPRYTRIEMSGIWTDESRFAKMLEVETLFCEAMAAKGMIPKADVDEIRKKARINVADISEIEKTVKHDVIAFLTQVERTVGPAARHMHLGMTSSDVLDTALALQMVDAAKLLREDLAMLKTTVAALAKKHKKVLMAGRTHGVHAEPTTFGLKVAGWFTEIERAEERLVRAQAVVSFGKISGAVGTYAHLDPSLEKFVLDKLGLAVEPVSTQIVPRDRHAEFLSELAVVGASLERFALEIRHLQRTEVLEAEEPFTEGQRGSSAMPHKRNPIASENICGLSRLLRSYALAALENVALWHERDISHSSVERVILPDATIVLDFMIHRMNAILKDLNVYPDRMRQNLSNTIMVLSSQRLLVEILKGKKKIEREHAYKVVQSIAQKAWTEKQDFKNLALKDSKLGEYLDKKTIEQCFDPDYFIRNVDGIFKRIGLN